jgi:hypothetical protein
MTIRYYNINKTGKNPTGRLSPIFHKASGQFRFACSHLYKCRPEFCFDEKVIGQQLYFPDSFICKARFRPHRTGTGKQVEFRSLPLIYGLLRNYIYPFMRSFF